MLPSVIAIFVLFCRFDDTMKDLESKYRDAKLEKWKQVSQPIEQWINCQEQALQSLQESPEDLNSLYKQQETTEVTS